MIDVLLSAYWSIPTIWLILYLIDIFSTKWLFKEYYNFLINYEVYEGGIEINPKISQGDAQSGRFSIFSLIIYFLLFIIFGWLSTKADLLKSIFEFVAGAIILLWLYINLEHLFNFGRIYFLRKRPESLSGKRILSYWYIRRLNSIKILCFGLFYLAFTILSWRLFYIGGASACFLCAIWFYKLATRIENLQH